MKKLIYCALALAAGLFAASCQQENLEPVQGGNTVTFTVEIPEVATKATVVDDGSNINNLVYAVYRTDESNLADAAASIDPKKLVYRINPNAQGEVTAFTADGKTNVTLELINNQKYIVLFWAQVDETWVEGTNFDLTTIAYPRDSELTANLNKYEAFCGAAFVDEVTGATKKSVTLTRPFAQINLASTDPSNYDVDIVSSSVKIENAYSQFNVATKKAFGTFRTVEYKVNANPDGNFGNYDHYVAMNYIFANPKNDGTTPVKVTCTINTEDHGLGIKKEINNVPVAQNYRTNIVGNLLTSDVDYEVTLDKDWGQPELAPDEIYLAAALGGEVTLTEDITLTAPLEVKAEMTLNLNGKTISGNFHKSVGAVIKNNGILTITGGTISSLVNNGGSAIANYGTLYVEDAVINGAPREGDSWPAYPINNYGSMTLTNTTVTGYQGCVALNAAGTTVLNNCNLTKNYEKTSSHVFFVNHADAKVTVNGGTYNHNGFDGSLAYVNEGEVTINNGTFNAKDGGYGFAVLSAGKVIVNGGNINAALQDWGGEFMINGGVFSSKPANKYIANGYKAISIDGKFYVLPKVVADAATIANVTAVTESTADVATALTTDNGEATMFMWNDVAYIAKYGEVVITSSADDATTARGVVENAADLKTATVAEGIEVVGNRTFRKCANLETVEFPNTLTEIGPAVFQSCSKLANVTIPASVTTIGEGAFAECTSLTSINIPSGVTRIEADALRATGLVSVEFHEGVTYFGAQAFRDCKQLEKVVINAPEFTMEGNTFGIMAAPFTPMTIEVANAEMKAYVESKLTDHAKTYITVVAPEVVVNTADLQAALAAGKKVVLENDLTITNDEGITAPYGNKTALSQNGGVFDGNGKTITSNILGDSYIYMTNGGTTKNVNITGAFRGIMVMSPTQTVYLDNVVSGGKGVVYAFNTGEGDSTQDVVATNCTFNGWSSWSLLKSATFTNCTFGQGSEYSNVYGRLLRPYVTTVFDGCDFCSKCYIDLSALVAEQMVTIKNCTVNGVKITAENWTSLVAPESTCSEGQISVELKNGTFLTAENLADYIVFE